MRLSLVGMLAGSYGCAYVQPQVEGPSFSRKNYKDENEYKVKVETVKRKEAYETAKKEAGVYCQRQGGQVAKEIHGYEGLGMATTISYELTFACVPYGSSSSISPRPSASQTSTPRPSSGGFWCLNDGVMTSCYPNPK